MKRNGLVFLPIPGRPNTDQMRASSYALNPDEDEEGKKYSYYGIIWARGRFSVRKRTSIMDRAGDASMPFPLAKDAIFVTKYHVTYTLFHGRLTSHGITITLKAHGLKSLTQGATPWNWPKLPDMPPRTMAITIMFQYISIWNILQPKMIHPMPQTTWHCGDIWISMTLSNIWIGWVTRIP